MCPSLPPADLHYSLHCPSTTPPTLYYRPCTTPHYSSAAPGPNCPLSSPPPAAVPQLGAAGLVETMKGPGPFTVFAPTDAAFAALPAGTLDSLLKPENKAKLVGGPHVL